MKIKEKQLSQINENSLFHFIKADSFEDVEKYGIKREFTNNAIEQATTYKVTFSKGPKANNVVNDIFIIITPIFKINSLEVFPFDFSNAKKVLLIVVRNKMII